MMRRVENQKKRTGPRRRKGRKKAIKRREGGQRKEIKNQSANCQIGRRKPQNQPTGRETYGEQKEKEKVGGKLQERENASVTGGGVVCQRASLSSPILVNPSISGVKPSPEEGTQV
jgi:hypothetical protein